MFSSRNIFSFLRALWLFLGFFPALAQVCFQLTSLASSLTPLAPSLTTTLLHMLAIQIRPNFPRPLEIFIIKKWSQFKKCQFEIENNWSIVKRKRKRYERNSEFKTRQLARLFALCVYWGLWENAYNTFNSSNMNSVYLFNIFYI